MGCTQSKLEIRLLWLVYAKHGQHVLHRTYVEVAAGKLACMPRVRKREEFKPAFLAAVLLLTCITASLGISGVNFKKFSGSNIIGPHPGRSGSANSVILSK